MKRALGVLLAALSLQACTIEATQDIPDSGTDTFIDVPATTRTYGIAWDPEAFWYSYSSWVAPPPRPAPQLQTGIAHLDRSYVYGAIVSVRTATGTVVGTTAAPTGDAGQWLVEDVPTSDAVHYTSATWNGTRPDGGAPPVPLTNYQPTFTARPLVPSTGVCFFQQAALLGDNGMLDAAAKYLTQLGTPTTVADLLDATKYGGALAVFAYQPGASYQVLPTPNAALAASAGTVLAFDWAAPGTAPDPSIQSARGFFVAAAPPTGVKGFFLVLVPVGTTGPVTLTLTDTVTDVPTRRPFTWTPTGVPPTPSVVTYVPLQGALGPPPPDAGVTAPPAPPAYWECQP